MNIFVIIVTYNAMRRQWAKKCLDSLLQSPCPLHIIVVDNQSTDDTQEFIPSHYPNIIWLPQDKNLGFGQGNNIGIKYALEHEADYLLLLNQDATLQDSTIQKMIEVSDGHSLLSPLQLNGDGSSIDEMFHYQTLNKARNRMLDDLLVRQSLQKIYPVGEFPAACWFLPVSIIKQIGGFNPLFFHYSEDNNYYQRLMCHGIKSYIVPHAKMFHDRSVHGNMTYYDKTHMWRNMLLIATNINKSFGQIIKEELGFLPRCYFRSLPKGKYIPGTFLVNSFRLLGLIPKIIISRKKEKQLGLTWL